MGARAALKASIDDTDLHLFVANPFHISNVGDPTYVFLANLSTSFRIITWTCFR